MVHKGHCLCGAIQFEVDDPSTDAVICHCTNCRRASSHCSMNLRTKIDLVKVTKGTPKVYDDNDTGSGKTVHRNFCFDCGSALWSNPDSVPGMSVVKVGILNNANDFNLKLQVNDKSKLNYTITPN